MSPWVIALLILAAAAGAALVVWREQVRGGARTSLAFVGEVKGEIQKVTWPDRQQLKNATLVILGFVALVALLIGVLDIVLQWLVVTLPGRVA